MEVLLQQMATSSESTGEYAAGTAGTISKLDGSKKYLLNDKGVEPIQLIEKGQSHLLQSQWPSGK